MLQWVSVWLRKMSHPQKSILNIPPTARGGLLIVMCLVAYPCLLMYIQDCGVIFSLKGVSCAVLVVLYSSLIVKHLLATVVTALGAYGVINMPCAAVAATGDSWCNSHVVSSSLGCAGLRLSTFRMCHFFVIYFLLLLFSFNCRSAAHRGSMSSSVASAVSLAGVMKSSSLS